MTAERDEDEVFELHREVEREAGPSGATDRFRVCFPVYGGSANELRSEAFDRLDRFVEDDEATDFRIVEIEATPLVSNFVDGTVETWKGEVEAELLTDREAFFV